MEIVEQRTMDEMKDKFLIKHELVRVVTEPFVDNGYSKSYIAKDGAEFTEYYRKVIENVKLTTKIKGVEVEISQNVELFETEFFSSDDAKSRYVYTRY